MDFINLSHLSSFLFYCNNLNQNELKTLQETYFWGIISPGGTTTCHQRIFSGHKESCKYCRCYFHLFLERILLRLYSNGITLNFKKCLFSKNSLLFNVFFQERYLTRKIRVRRNWKSAHTEKNAKHLRT